MLQLIPAAAPSNRDRATDWLRSLPALPDGLLLLPGASEQEQLLLLPPVHASPSRPRHHSYLNLRPSSNVRWSGNRLFPGVLEVLYVPPLHRLDRRYGS